MVFYNSPLSPGTICCYQETYSHSPLVRTSVPCIGILYHHSFALIGLVRSIPNLSSNFLTAAGDPPSETSVRNDVLRIRRRYLWQNVRIVSIPIFCAAFKFLSPQTIYEDHKRHEDNHNLHPNIIQENGSLRINPVAFTCSDVELWFRFPHTKGT